MNQDEIKAYLAWLDEKFGLMYPEGNNYAQATLWGNTVAFWTEGEVTLVGSRFGRSALAMYEEWSEWSELK